MKKSTISMAVAICLSCSMLFSSCVGSFTLTNKLLSWNRTVGNKFVNELVFVAFWVLPVYEVSALADVLVLNSIEFWSGDNPVASKETRTVKGSDGQEYLVETDAQGYTITAQQTGRVTRLDWNADTRSWTLSVDGESAELFSFIDDDHISMPAADGSRMTVELSRSGVMAYETAR